MRKIALDIHAHDAARDLFILERKAERGILWKYNWRRPWKPLGPTLLMFFYSALSNCGRSVVLPLIWLGVSTAGFYVLYAERIAGLARHNLTSAPSGGVGERFVPAASLDAETAEAVWAFTLANAVPFIGSASTAWRKAAEVLFGAGPVPPAIYLLSLGQGIVNTLLLFLLALSLRNHFKVN